MRVHVVAVGRLKDEALRSATDVYVRRIGRYARYVETELKEGSPGQVADRLRRAPGARARVVALEVDGVGRSSRGFAELVRGAEDDGAVDELAFLVGGSHGLPPEVSRGADVRLSLGPMTLPHRLCRLVLVEQIYRAFTILRGEPYDH